MDSHALQFLSATTCQDIDEFINDLNPSEYLSRNITREDYIQSLRPTSCELKPFPTLQGYKKWIVTSILLTLLIFGLIGNLLSATIMFRRARRGLSSYFYLAILAIIDICILYTSCLFLFLEITFNYHPHVYSTFLCRFAFYLQHFFTYVSAWLLVALTFERLMVVRYPFQSINISRIQVTYTITLLIFVIFAIYTAHCFFTMDIITANIQGDESYDPNFRLCDLVFYPKLLAFIDLCLYSVVPSILILIFNVLIIFTMFHAIEQRREYLQVRSYLSKSDVTQRNKQKSASTIRTQFLRSRSAESSPIGHSSALINKQRIYHHQPILIESSNKTNAGQKIQSDSTSATGIRLTCLLLIVSFIFVICTLPISIRSLISEYLPSQKSTTRWQMIQLSLTLLMFFNHAFNFVLYCLTGRAFRIECRKLLKSLWFFKDLRVSCTTGVDSDKYPYHHHHQQQQFMLNDRNRFQTQQRQLSPSRQVVHL